MARHQHKAFRNYQVKCLVTIKCWRRSHQKVCCLTSHLQKLELPFRPEVYKLSLVHSMELIHLRLKLNLIVVWVLVSVQQKMSILRQCWKSIIRRLKLQSSYLKKLALDPILFYHHSDKKNWKVSLRNNSNSVKHILQELPLLEMVAASYHSLIKRKAQLLVTCFTNRNLISTSTWKDSSIKLHKLGERHTNGLKLKWHLRLDLDWWYKIVLFKTQMLLLSYKPNRERTRVHQTDHRQKDQGLG